MNVTMEAVTILSMLTSAGEVLAQGLTLIWSFITSNMYLIFGVGVSVIGTVIGVFKGLKRTV